MKSHNLKNKVSIQECDHFYNEFLKLHNIHRKYLSLSYQSSPVTRNIELHHKNIEMVNNKLVKDYVNNADLYKIIFGKNNLRNLHFYFCVKKNEAVNVSLLNRLIFIALYFYERSKKRINIYWIPINIKRVYKYKSIYDIKESQERFSAFSTSGVNLGNTSVVTRIEEVEKLLIHELIHNIKLDMRDKIPSQIYNKYTVDKSVFFNCSLDNSPILLIEIFTEWSCTMYYIMFYIFFLIQSLDFQIEIPISKDKFNALFDILYQTQKKYSYKTILKILHLNQYNSIKSFNKTKIFYGDYPFYEYYYLKFMAMYHLDYTENIHIYNDILKLLQLNLPVSRNAEKYFGKIKKKLMKKKMINFKFISFS